MLQSSHEKTYRSTSQPRSSAFEETISAVKTNTIKRRQELLKTEMTTRIEGSEKLARVGTTGPFLVKDTS